MTNDETIVLLTQLLKSKQYEIDFTFCDLEKLLENSKKFLSQDTIAEISHKLEGILQLESEIGKTNISEQLLKKLQQEKEDFVILFLKRIKEEKLQQRYNDEYIAWVQQNIAKILLSISLQNLDLARLQPVEAAVLLKIAEELLRVSELLQQKNSELLQRIEKLPLDNPYRQSLTNLCNDQSERLIDQSALAKEYLTHGQQLVHLETQKLNEEQLRILADLKQALLTHETELADCQRREFEVTRQMEDLRNVVINNNKDPAIWRDVSKKLKQLGMKDEELHSRIRILQSRTTALSLQIHQLRSEMNKPASPTSKPDSSLSSILPHTSLEDRSGQGPESTPPPSNSTNGSRSYKSK